jgi:hypothetical protein
MSGDAGAAIEAWCSRRKIRLHVFDWREAYGNVGIARNSLYLLRPDAFVGLAAADGASADLDGYCKDSAAIRLGGLAA